MKESDNNHFTLEDLERMDKEMPKLYDREALERTMNDVREKYRKINEEVGKI